MAAQPAARPKPFLPLLPTGETLLQRTVERLAGAGARTSGATSPWSRGRATRRSSASSCPASGHREPMGRNTAAAIALATLAIERDDDDVMVVLPADHRIDPAREGTFRSVLAAAADGLATGPFGVDSPLVTLGVRPTHAATRVRLPGARAWRRARTWHGLAGVPAAPPSRRSPPRRDAGSLVASPGRRLERRHVPVAAARRSARRSSGTRAPTCSSGVAAGSPSGDLAAAYARLPPLLDRLRGDGGRRARPARS